MKESLKIYSIIGVSIILIVGLVLVTSGALNPNSRFYGEWNVDTDESSTFLESIYTTVTQPVIHITFEPDGILSVTFYSDGQPVTSIYGTYAIISSTRMYMTMIGATSDNFRYSFANRNMVLTLTEEISGAFISLNKIRDL